MRRLTVLCVVTASLVTVGVLFIPRASRGWSRDTLDTPQTRDLVGELVGSQHRVRIYAGNPDPCYTVLTIKGSVLASNLSADEVALRFPDLPIITNPRGAVLMSDVAVDAESQR